MNILCVHSTRTIAVTPFATKHLPPFEEQTAQQPGQKAGAIVLHSIVGMLNCEIIYTVLVYLVPKSTHFNGMCERAGT